VTGLVLSLARLFTRLILGVAIAFALGLLIAVLRDSGGFRDDLGIACLLVGCLFLLMAPAGHSPALRGGTIDTWTASFFPQLLPAMTSEYSGRTLSTSVVLGLTGIVLLVVGAVLVG
jgi:hypothetical protein